MYSIPGVAIRGVSTCVPTTVAKSADYEMLTPDERARFAKVTGIEAHRISAEEQCASDLCSFAVDDVLRGVGWDKADIGLMVLITQSPDYPVPATSIVMQNKLGLPQNCISFDVNLGCSAYPFGLSIVASMMRTMSIKRALLVVGDASTKGCAYTDKSAWPLFSDAGTATAMELDDAAAPMHFHLMNDGAGYQAIMVPTGGFSSRLRLTPELLEPVELGDGIKRNSMQLALDGPEIFNFAIREAPNSINTLLQEHKSGVDDVDFFVLHQANKIINDTIRVKIGASREKMLSSLKDFGNGASGSVPLTLSLNADKLNKADSNVLMCGFGVGLSWGSVMTRLPADCYLKIIENDAVYAG
ncbi:ketoacyl-ACP synthase III [Herbaspirillum sp. WKF16]|uniref:3-oxoacyl-ACP synthase III family protein n=1 Tax=Herbaspirillum sp. WKF16 TaxID=3028312 RepID=UPI0023A99C6A|nr:ketoacyl-ACP synthase III [Herbaspirillum sp. WKF16]WDZ95744.1 ketoacyl-ACP synthase III [Herbaspirillum sp. WKF16]